MPRPQLTPDLMPPLAADHPAVQLSWYLLVGCLCTAVDLGCFVLLTRLEVSLLVATPASFLAGTVANYFLSYSLAFQRGRFSRAHEITRLFAVSLVGLTLNSTAVYAFVQLGLSGLVAKVVAVPCVLGWNFLARRTFVFRRELPEATRELSERAIDALRGEP
jgi:putative flippase GtrA